MEVNPRPWGSIEVAERNGAQMCRTFAELLADRAVSPQILYEAGREFLVLEAFVHSRQQSDIGSTLGRLGARDAWGCAAALPWSRPRLALHVLRRLYQIL
jgi:hypothetical protein